MTSPDQVGDNLGRNSVFQQNRLAAEVTKPRRVARCLHAHMKVLSPPRSE